MRDDPIIFGPPPETPELAGATLNVDLKVLQDNWRQLARETAPAMCAATIKGDAYGLGLEPVARALAAAGCGTFFVALPHEGAALRRVLPAADIFVLNGLMAKAAPRPVRQNNRRVQSKWSMKLGVLRYSSG